MARIRNIDTLPLDGGALCFNFINTVYAWKGINLHEYLHSYEEVIKWCEKVNILAPSQRLNLLKLAKLHPSAAQKALTQLKQTRETLYHLFSAIATSAHHPVSSQVLSQFNTALSLSLSHVAFKVIKKKLELTWSNPHNDLVEPLWPVMKSAWDMLTIEDSSRIKECAKCGWMFIDSTKNNKRRWCNPSFCGSTEKSKKYYQKIRKLQNV